MSKPKLTPERLAEMIDLELDRRAWGDLDSFLFSLIADGEAEENEQAVALRDVLSDVIQRLSDAGYLAD